MIDSRSILVVDDESESLRLLTAMLVAEASSMPNREDGDTLTVWKLDRLGRSLHDLITMLDDQKHHEKLKTGHGSLSRRSSFLSSTAPFSTSSSIRIKNVTAASA
jgi:Resolvase, N terminal domain